MREPAQDVIVTAVRLFVARQPRLATDVRDDLIELVSRQLLSATCAEHADEQRPVESVRGP